MFSKKIFLGKKKPNTTPASVCEDTEGLLNVFCNRK